MLKNRTISTGLIAVAVSSIFIVCGWLIIECSILAIAAYRFNKIQEINEHTEQMNKRFIEQSNQISSTELTAYKKTLLQYKETVNKYTAGKELTEARIESLLDKINKAQR